MSELTLYRGEVFDFIDSPLNRKDAYRYFPDGALVVREGEIVDCGPFEDIKGRYTDYELVDYSGKLLMPGFIDSHIHYPQAEIIGMYGRQLLDWLEDYTFPAEQAFVSSEHADKMAHFFVEELFRNGTTACMAYATVHPTSVTALFSVASEYNMCMLTGKVLMDRNAPAGLTDTAEQGKSESRSLIESWHGKGRNRYVITPRFAISCSTEQLIAAGRLHDQYPGTYIQTHLSENKDEIDSTLSLCPDCQDYLEVYERARLVTDRSIFGHCIHLSDSECRRLVEAGSVVAHCPTSNLFLGSGLICNKPIVSVCKPYWRRTSEPEPLFLCCARWERRIKCSNLADIRCLYSNHYINVRWEQLKHFIWMMKSAVSGKAGKRTSLLWIMPPHLPSRYAWTI